MKSISILSRAARHLAALGALAAAAVAVAATPASAATIPPGGMAVEGASLDWTGSTVMQSPFAAGPMKFFHYFSAGISEGTEATYKGVDGNAEVRLEAEGPEAVASWATHTNFGPEAGKHQVVRLLNGTGRIEADGSATIAWNAGFSVNFYSGSAPFSVENPTLIVKPDGTGELTATLSGCKASKAEPQAGCVPFAPVPGAQVATFSGVSIDPDAALTIAPHYAGVTVETAGGTPQNREVEGWGAWPQSFVTFQLNTGLSSFFYSSGSGEDPKKAPLPFVIDFKGPKPTPPAPTPSSPNKPESTPTPVSAPGPAKLAASKGLQKFGADGVAKVASLACPSGGATCTTTVPKRLGAKIAGKRYVLGVMAPKKIGAGKSATVKVHVPKAAREALGKKKYQVKLPVALHANGATTKQVVKVEIAGRR
ncbi:MAG: hypothetical protein JST53_16070 [Actinobacteria bacterium]|nr:hypothetical protein [Actinomycetota bacterium]